MRFESENFSDLSTCTIHPTTPQGVYVIKEHRMPNYVVPGFGMTKGDKYLNVQKVKSRLEKHIETIFESSYMTEIIELP